MKRLLTVSGLLALFLAISAPPVESACCYFAAKDADILQPAQKAFITWDPKEGVETFTVQPKFERNAKDFGMVIPTPSGPKLDEMPRDFFKELAVYTILKKREYPRSKLLLEYQLQTNRDSQQGASGTSGREKGREKRTRTYSDLFRVGS